MIWRATTKVGYGLTTRRDPRPRYAKLNLTMAVVVAKYSPPGNYMRRFAANVYPQKPGCEDSLRCPQ